MPTLLVIDDNKSVRDILQMVLVRKGYTVLMAANGADGLALCADRMVDGVMVDLNMPGMDGIQVCQALHEQANIAGRAISVWLMTGGYTREAAKLAVQAGALSLIRKPFQLDELYRQLEGSNQVLTG